MGCPFSCAFCNQWKITGVQAARPEEVISKVDEVLSTLKGAPERIEVAFFGGSFTGLSTKQQVSWLEQAYALKEQGKITGIRLSTRPDYITVEILDRLISYGVTTIELGVQSLVDEILEKSSRGHTSAITYQATKLIRKYPFELIYQLMLGLPGDNQEKAYYTAKKTIQEKPDGVRIYPAVVLKDTALAEYYSKGLYKPWTLTEAVDMGARWLGLFSYYRITVIRLGLQSTDSLRTEEELLAGPYHPAYGELVESRLMLEQIKEVISRIRVKPQKIRIVFNSRDHSKVIGHKKANVTILKSIFPETDIEFIPDATVNNNDLLVGSETQTISLSRQEFLEKYRIEDEE